MSFKRLFTDHPHHGRALLTALVLFLGLGVLLFGAGAPLSSAEPTPAAQSRPASGHRPVDFDLILEYLKRWEVENTSADREEQTVRFRLKVDKRSDPLDCVIQVKTRRDGQTFDRLYIAFLDLASVPAASPRLLEVLKTLATLNWQNAIGKYSWDETDGEIRLEYAMVANRGLCYEDFADVMRRLALIANTDRPVIQRARWQ